MHLPFDFEKNILEKCQWSEKQADFYGTLIYNLTNSTDEPVADIICRRDSKGINIDWFVPNQEGDKITLSYLRDSNSIDFQKTDSEIKTEKDVLFFLDNISKTIQNQKGDFFPKEKITHTVKSKFSI